MEPVKTSRIYLAGVAANISYIALGTCVGWTSPVLLKLKSPDLSESPLSKPITATEEAWISSSIALAALVAPFVGGPLADKVGRKAILIYGSIFYMIAYTLMAIASEAWHILLGRVFQGVAVGVVMTVLPMYSGEISTDSVRGGVGSLNQLSMVLGILYVYSIGPFVSYAALQYACLAVPILFIFVFFFMPESPYYYVGKGKMPEALKSLQFLRGQSINVVEEELSQIQKNLEEARANKGSLADVFTVSGNRKALFITTSLLALQQFSGINVVIFNSQSIFESANVGLSSALSSIIIALMLFASSMLGSVSANRLGRKTLLYASATLMCLGLVALGTFFYVQNEGRDVSAISWLPLTALIIFLMSHCPGFGGIPWSIMGEMFSSNVKPIASAFSAASNSVASFIVTFIYPLVESNGLYYVFWMHAILCVIAFFFVYFFVMETKGLSLQEIQNRLNGKNDHSKELIINKGA